MEEHPDKARCSVGTGTTDLDGNAGGKVLEPGLCTRVHQWDPWPDQTYMRSVWTDVDFGAKLRSGVLVIPLFSPFKPYAVIWNSLQRTK